MFGTKLRTWMETHIVRSRKKQQRNKEDKKSGNCSNIIGTSSGHVESNSFERQYGKRSPKYHEVKGVLEFQPTDISLPSKTSMSLQQSNTVQNTVNNLSSPESAYSTGYSTDGTSPGASIPPEYYINIRTGTHYFHSQSTQGVNAPTEALPDQTESKVESVPPQSAVTITVLSPRLSRHRREDAVKKKVKNGEQVPESSTEEDIADRLVKVNCPSQSMAAPTKVKNKLVHPVYSGLHRRTESYDENQQRATSESQERDSSDSLTNVTVSSYQCSSPYLPGASPRQRTRIRTNPWLGGGNSGDKVEGKAYNSQGETSSTVGSSSTLSSSGRGCLQTSDDNSNQRRKLVKDHLHDVKNCNALQNPSIVFSPILNGKKHLNAVTTCSPQPNRSCHHVLRPRSPASSSSASSAPSSASDDDHHGNTSDFSDDDVTLNEMLGKYDESYVYEKETDILSDSDPTDCEEEERTDNSNLPDSERQEDFDFIDHGSQAELAQSDSECSSKAQMIGLCTYHTPEATRKLTPRLRESLLRRQSASRGSRERQQSRHSSRHRQSDIRTPNSGSPLSHRRSATYRKSSSQSLDHKHSCEVIPPQSPYESPTKFQYRRSRRRDSVPKKTPGEAPGKYINLNRVLMERLINNQRNGTRSADGTPVSLRKRSNPGYNGKYMKNHYVSNLISSDTNFNERRSNLEVKHIDPDHIDGKPRSNSMSVYSNPSINVFREPNAAGVVLNDLDKEGDLKYRQLIQEAEHIIEDLQVKTKSPHYLSPTFKCKNGMERAKPSSPLVFSVPPSPLSLRYDLYRDNSSADAVMRESERANNNSIYEQPAHVYHPLHKEKSNENEEGLLKTISKTLERIIIRGNSDTNRKLDKSVSDPFAKGKKRFVLPSTTEIYSNLGVTSSDPQNGGPYAGFATPNLLRRSSTGNTPLKLSTYSSASKLNQNEITSQSGFRKFFRRQDKYKTTSFEEHLDKHNFPENGFCLNSGFSKSPSEHIYENGDVCHPINSPSKTEVHNARYAETKTPIADYSPNGNTPAYINGFQQIPWQHRTSQAERLKHLSDLRSSPKRKTDSPELPFEQKPSLVSFRSFDLGNKNAVASGYCPQSEPVKRKIYTCSATFEKLQKTLLRKQPEIHPCNDSPKNTDSVESSCNKLKSRVTHLRRERLQAERKVRESQGQIHRFETENSDGTG